MTHPVAQAGGVRLRLAGADDIRGWSGGEIVSPETRDPATGHPIPGGLYCENVFGPAREWHGRAGRQRQGHIELAAPVVHTWFLNRTRALSTLLGLTRGDVRKVVNCQELVVTDHGSTPLARGQLLTDDAFEHARATHGDSFRADTGAAAVRQQLLALDLRRLAVDLREQLRAAIDGGTSSATVRQLRKRVRLVEELCDSGNRLEWLVLDCIPVLPPALRRGPHCHSAKDLDELYARIIRRNQRLRKLTDLNAPAVILRNERRMLQQAVDALFDNGHCRQPLCDRSNRRLESLTDRLRSRLRHSRGPLAGKRVDYSARSVAVPGPELKLHQCGLPWVIALELYRPFVLGWLIDHGGQEVRARAEELAREFRPNADPPPNWPTVGERVKELGDIVWTALAEVVKGRPVVVGRPPVSDRSRLLAFQPVLGEGKAVRVHPLAGQSMGLAFDGEEVVLYLPLSLEAQAEAAERMAPPANLFSPANGRLSVAPSRDVVLGCYFLTAHRGAGAEAVEAGDGLVFHSPAELIQAHDEGKLGLHARIRVRLPLEKKVIAEDQDERGETKLEELPRKANGLVSTTVGRVLFNDILPLRMAFYDLPMSGGNLSRIVTDCHQLLGDREAAGLLDRIKTLGFRAATRSGLSLAMSDLLTPENKPSVLGEAEKQTEKLSTLHERGVITDNERFNKVLDTWMTARVRINSQLIRELQEDRRPDPVSGRTRPHLNPLWMMAQAGVCGVEHLRRLAGMHGLVVELNGCVQELPITGNYREGLTALEYWSSLLTVRATVWKELLKPFETADLTRRLIAAAGEVVVSMPDCGTHEGTTKRVMFRGHEVARPLADALRGRVARRTLTSARDGSVAVSENELITPNVARRIERLGIDTFPVRSPMTCRAPGGVCQLCYGADPTSGQLIMEGTAVGVLAGQSLGAPETDRPRLRQILELRRPNRATKLAEVSGVVHLGERIGWERLILVQPTDGDDGPTGDPVEHRVPAGSTLRVTIGERVEKGEPLLFGDPVPYDLLRVLGPEAVRNHLMEEIGRVYRIQRLDLDDRHLEVVIARMLRLSAASATTILRGITTAASHADSFLAPAPYQDFARVLAAAALAGRVAPLTGVNENVILGGLIPVGTGWPYHREGVG